MELELARSNTELEQFAYVASHDLRQPLRMVSSYLGIVASKLGPGLPDDIRTCIDFAVDGAKRMDALILGLLEYSRVGRASEIDAVALDIVVAEAIDNLSVVIKDSEAEIVVATKLPTVLGDRIELMRLFQNLIGNAVKYRAKDRIPHVEIRCQESGAEWQLSVADNGIGIAPEDRDRAFALFQRLVGREHYEGTGIGLAVCKKIVEHHGGKIWVESQIGKGCTFCLTLPAAGDQTKEAAICR